MSRLPVKVRLADIDQYSLVDSGDSNLYTKVYDQRIKIGVTSMEQKYWEQFTHTGKVEDYLYYKGIETCRSVMDKYEGKNSESGNRSNRHGAVGITDRGVR